MEIRILESLPEEARDIRERVFVREQGFLEEFDEIDGQALHLLAIEDGKPVGTCRIFWDEEKDAYLIGRLAILPEYRGKKIGAKLLLEAKEQVNRLGGTEAYLHAQHDKAGFYEKCGYQKIGEMELEQGYPHIWMVCRWNH